MKGRKRKHRQGLSLAVMMSDLMLASWETIARRSFMILQNDCSPAEYRRMANEKAEAVARSAARLVSGRGRATMTSLVAPWHSRAIANAKRLRKKQADSCHAASFRLTTIQPEINAMIYFC